MARSKQITIAVNQGKKKRKIFFIGILTVALVAFALTFDIVAGKVAPMVGTDPETLHSWGERIFSICKVLLLVLLAFGLAGSPVIMVLLLAFAVAIAYRIYSYW